MNQPINLWIDAVSFDQKGGWKVDTQFSHLMGSGFLIAANVPGEPVEDATCTVQIPQADTYRIWVRDRNWLRPHNPGTFHLLVNGENNGTVLGAMPSDSWIWEIAGDFQLAAGDIQLALHDLTGYFGRCASILITNDFDYTPPRETALIHRDRANFLGLDVTEKDGGSYDVIVAGGGPGGVPAAIAAARGGAKTLLIHNRPVLGGNGSREIGITFEGASSHYPYAREGGIAEEMRRLRDQIPEFTGDWSAALQQLTENQENLTVLYNSHVCGADMSDGETIQGVRVLDVENFTYSRYRAQVFIDCTGDGWLGHYAGAKYRLGRESQQQHQETLAPEQADTLTMSGCIRSDHIPFLVKREEPWEFHAPDWVPKLPEDPEEFGRSIDLPGTRLAWWVEAPNTYDDMYDAEVSRDALFLVLLGYIDHLKNAWSEREVAKMLHFHFASIMLGRRESRRFIGDYILTQDDCISGARFEDAVSYTGWHIDIHHPEGIYSGKKGGLYCSVCANMPHVPFRSLYSKNIRNLLFAGRNISTTHIAMGTTRVQNTIATLGQAVGTAAAMCIKLEETPRGIYQNHMKALQQKLLKDDLYIPDVPSIDPGDPCLAATATASSACTAEEFTLRRGIPGDLVPLDRGRMITSGVSRFNGDVERFYVKLHNAAQEPRTVTVHACIQGSNVDSFSQAQEEFTAQIVVPPAGEHWVEVPIYLTIPMNIYLETCLITVRLDPAQDISWRIINGLNMYWRYGEQLPDGSWKVRNGKSYFAQFTQPQQIMANCGPENVNNGYNRIVDAEHYEWVSDPALELPQWVMLTFDKATAINSISAVFDTDLANPIVSWSGKNPTPARLVKDYTVEVFCNGEWRTVAEVQNNIMRKRIHTFPTTVAEKIRITVGETWGDPCARIMEVRASLEE